MIQTFCIAYSAIRHFQEFTPDDYTMLCYIAAKPKNWVFHYKDTMREVKMGKNRMYNSIGILIRLGWIKRKNVPKEENPKESAGVMYEVIDKYNEEQQILKFFNLGKDNVSTYLTSSSTSLNGYVNKDEVGNNNISFPDLENLRNSTNNQMDEREVTGEELQRKIKHKLGEYTLAVFNAYPEKNTKGEMQPIKKTYEDAEAIADFIDKNNITSEGMIDCFNAFIDLCDAKDIFYPYLSTHLKDFAAKFRRWGSAENVVKDYQQSMDKAKRMQSTTKYETQIKELKTYIPSDVTITDDRDYPRVVALFNLYGTDEVLNAFKRGKIRTRKTLASVLSCIEQQKSETMPCVNF